MTKYKIGRELILLNNLEEHIFNLENYYKDYLTGKKKIQNYNGNYDTGHSLRYFLVQHLEAFDEITEQVLDDHNVIDGLKIVKLSKVIDILRNKNNFLRKIRNLSKGRIFNIIEGETTSTGMCHRYAEHYFLGNRFAVNFEITIDYTSNQITIDDAFVGEQNNKNELLSKLYKHLIGKKF